MTIALGILFLIMQIVSLVLFIVVLIRLFKKEGALKGILGFFCGIYTFIWGWLKHKELALTKIMALWSILTVASIVIQAVIATSGAFELLNSVNSLKGDAKVKWTQPETDKIKAISVVKKAAKKALDKKVDWSQKAMALWQDGQYKDPQKAIGYWDRAIKKKQNGAKAYNNRGLAYHNLKQYQRAIQDFNEAINLDAGYAAAYNNRGNSYYELTDYELALADFDQSLQLKPDHAKAHLNRGLVYYQLEETDQACSDFQKSCKQGDCDGLNWAMTKALCQ